MVNIDKNEDRERIINLARKLLDGAEFNETATDLVSEIEAADQGHEDDPYVDFEFFLACDENGIIRAGEESEEARERLTDDTQGDILEITKITGRVRKPRVKVADLGDIEHAAEDEELMVKAVKAA
jgi:hypothetical protein